MNEWAPVVAHGGMKVRCRVSARWYHAALAIDPGCVMAALKPR